MVVALVQELINKHQRGLEKKLWIHLKTHLNLQSTMITVLQQGLDEQNAHDPEDIFNLSKNKDRYSLKMNITNIKCKKNMVKLQYFFTLNI